MDSSFLNIGRKHFFSRFLFLSQYRLSLLLKTVILCCDFLRYRLLPVVGSPLRFIESQKLNLRNNEFLFRRQ